MVKHSRPKSKQTSPNKAMARHHCEIFNLSKIFTLEKKTVLIIQVNLEVYTNVVRRSENLKIFKIIKASLLNALTTD